MKTTSLLVSLGAILALCLWGAGQLWAQTDLDFGWFGWSMLIGGILVSVALGGGLMWLSFHSNRAGYDDRAQDASRQLDPALDRDRERGD